MRVSFCSRSQIISLCCFALASAAALAQEFGVTITGEMGITLTAEELSRRDALSLATDAAAARGRPKLRPDRRNLPDNLKSTSLTTAQRAAAVSGGTIAPSAVTVSTSFTGATSAETLAVPPDTMGAVGPSQFIVAVNGRLRSFNKATGVADGALNLSMSAFFSSVMTPIGGAITGNFTSDPHIRYDRLSGRWMLIVNDIPNGSLAVPNRVLLAVSSGGTISGTSSFTFFQFSPMPLAGAVSADSPTLGIDANALYIGVNMFTATPSFAGTSGFVVRKSSILGAGPIVTTAFTGLATASSAGPYTPHGVDNYDVASTEGYFIGVSTVSNIGPSTLIIRRVSTPGGTPTISANIPLTAPMTAYPIRVPHLGRTGAGLSDSGDRLNAAHVRNGRLWTVHAIQVNASGVASVTGGRNGSRWYEIQNLTTTPTLVQSGTVFDSAATNPLSYWMPSVVVSGQGHAYMGFSSAGATAYANAAATVRWAGAPLGTTQTPINYTASTTAYNRDGGRWGDYSYTSLDPEDDMTAWTIQQFCNATNSYGVQVAKLLAPPPPPTLAAAPSSITSGQASVNVVITGSGITAAAAQGFYDPGSGFAKRLAASIPGLIVNSVTFTSATSITVNVSTVSATAGSKNVTVTNPDGQAVTANALLTVTVPTAQSINFPAVTAFSWYQGSATLAATATSTLALTYTVLSGPCIVTGSTLIATLSGSCVIAADQAGNATFASAAQQTQNVTINVGPALLDIDASGATTRYDPTTDGMMVLRFLLGFSTNAVASGVTGASATRSAAQIGAHLTSIQTLLDIDGDGTPRASTDGLLIMRYLLGLRGSALVAGIPIGGLSTPQIESRISRLMP